MSEVRNRSNSAIESPPVLLVDDSGLPAEFGDPQTPAGDGAVTVANIILGFWVVWELLCPGSCRRVGGTRGTEFRASRSTKYARTIGNYGR